VALVALGDRVYWINRGAVPVRLERHGDGFAVIPLGRTLLPPRGSRGWRLRGGGDDRAQVPDSLLGRLLAGLAGAHDFLAVDERGRPAPATLRIQDGLLVALDRGAKGCVPALLRPDPSRNHELPVRAPSPPARGRLAARTFDTRPDEMNAVRAAVAEEAR
jgi:hypothetical protein